MVVTATFVEQANKGRPPQKRFRFAQPCVEGGCMHWTGARCNVIDQAILHEWKMDNLPDSLPHCGIRRYCRWFDQRGPSACRVCPLVVTDPRPPT
jgi:hypothetical protein